jgi:glycogen synthase
MERAGVESSDAVIAVSQAMRDDIISHYNVDPARVVVIHNGIDLAAYRRVEDRKALDARGIRQPYVLFVGRVSRQKGITYLLEAAESFPEGVTLVLCASSPDTPELQEEVVQKVSRMRNVVWIDRMLPKSELVQLYSHASVFVCPSVYEPFGIINLEAMACETAVVATAVGGIPEVVEDGITGILVEPGNPVDLARAVTGILESPDVARRMGEAGRARVEERFSWQAIAKQTKRLYEEIAAS